LASQARNKDLYCSTKALVIAVLELINNKLLQGMKIPAETKQRYIVENDNSCRIDYEQSISWAQLFVMLEKEIHNLPQYNACLKVMQADDMISKHLDTLVGTCASRWRFTADQSIGGLLKTQVLSFFEKRYFDEKIFDSDYACLEAFFYNQNIALISISPLINFSSEVDTIELNSGLRIRELTLVERGNLMDELRAMPFSGLLPQLGIKYVIECEYSAEKVLGDKPGGQNSKPEVDVQEIISKVITALRLLKPGNVIGTFVKSQYKQNSLGGISYSGPFSDNRLLGGITYNLKKTELEEFQLLWEKIDNSAINTVALRRFNYSYARENAEDKLIDMMIALEALFLKGEKAGASSGLIISVACSVLNGKTTKERELIKEKINSAYNLRNKIVHGIEFDRFKKDSKTGVNYDIIHETAVEIENYLRDSIKKLLD
jgi:hypothetical protein